MRTFPKQTMNEDKRPDWIDDAWRALCEEHPELTVSVVAYEIWLKGIRVGLDRMAEAAKEALRG